MTAAENGNWYMVNRDGMATLVRRPRRRREGSRRCAKRLAAHEDRTAQCSLRQRVALLRSRPARRAVFAAAQSACR